jgi:hypothetical protein
MPVSEFSLNADKFAETVKGRLEEFTIEFVQDLNEQIVRSTPVKFGNLRAHWWSAVNAKPNASAGGADKQGAATIAKLNLSSAAIKPGDVYFMTNGAAYAMRIEFGFVGTDKLGRRYNQAPRAFVRKVLARADKIAAKTAARVGAR